MAIIGVSGCNAESQQFTLVVDDEAIEPAGSGFTAIGDILKHVRVVDAAIAADG